LLIASMIARKPNILVVLFSMAAKVGILYEIKNPPRKEVGFCIEVYKLNLVYKWIVLNF